MATNPTSSDNKPDGKANDGNKPDDSKQPTLEELQAENQALKDQIAGTQKRQQAQLDEQAEAISKLSMTQGGEVQRVIVVEDYAKDNPGLSDDNKALLKDFEVSFVGPNSESFKQPVKVEALCASEAVSRVYQAAGIKNGRKYRPTTKCKSPTFEVLLEDNTSTRVRARTKKAAEKAAVSVQSVAIKEVKEIKVA